MYNVHNYDMFYCMYDKDDSYDTYYCMYDIITSMSCITA